MATNCGAGQFSIPTRRTSTATLSLLGSGALQVAVWRGSMAVATSCSILAENMRAGEAVEFALPETQSQTSGGPQQPGAQRTGGSGCECHWCAQGPITFRDGKNYVKDEATGAEIEVQQIPPPPPDRFQDVKTQNAAAEKEKKDPPKFNICGNVINKACAGDKGFVLSLIRINPSPKIMKTGTKCLYVRRDPN